MKWGLTHKNIDIYIQYGRSILCYDVHVQMDLTVVHTNACYLTIHLLISDVHWKINRPIDTKLKQIYIFCFLFTMHGCIFCSFHKAWLPWSSYKYEEGQSYKMCTWAYLLPHEEVEWRSTDHASIFLADFRHQNQIFLCHIVQCQGAGSLEHNTV